MLVAAFDAVTGLYIDNEQSWAGVPEFPAGAVFFKADKPWLKKVVDGKLVDDADKIAANAAREAEEALDRAVARAKERAVLIAAREHETDSAVRAKLQRLLEEFDGG